MDGYFDAKKYLPYSNHEIEVITPYGKRRAMEMGRYTLGLFFTDCTHPLMNMNCSISEVKYWRYIDNKLNQDMLVKINHYERVKEGENILSTIKEPLLYRIFNQLKHKLHL